MFKVGDKFRLNNDVGWWSIPPGSIFTIEEIRNNQARPYLLRYDQRRTGEVTHGTLMEDATLLRSTKRNLPEWF